MEPITHTNKTQKSGITKALKFNTGDKVLVALGAANRDPAQFPDPDCFDITRVNNSHLAFADGIHYCLGAILTRIEAEIAITALVQQLPDLKLSQDKLEWRNKIAFRSLKALPVIFKPTNIK
ncbi:cytochrome P450 [Nostoc sp.]|uniref:cytochrome P450 n=1 Tax=Nostoc sp. TaxID=1180 RepID=UPI002FF4DF26